MADKLEFIRDELVQRREDKSYINIPTMESPADGWMIVNGKKVLNFCTNNYLGLANHPELKKKAKGMTKKEQATLVGQTIAERAKKKGIKEVVFDRGGYKYIGRVAALADGAREKGLQF